MRNDVMTDRLIDYINDRIEDLDMTRSSLVRSIGLDKNSVTKYLKKEWMMPLHAVLEIASYLNVDTGRTCGIQTEQVLTLTELNLMRELRSIRGETSRVRPAPDLISITKSFNSSHRQCREQDIGLMVSFLLPWFS